MQYGGTVILMVQSQESGDLVVPTVLSIHLVIPYTFFHLQVKNKELIIVAWLMNLLVVTLQL